MKDAYDSLISLLASGARVPPANVDAICQASGVGPGDLIGDVMRRLDVVPPCPCGGRQHVYSTHATQSGRTQYLRCVCGRRSKRVCYGVAK